MTRAPEPASRSLLAGVGGAFLVNGVAATMWLAATPAIADRLDITVGGFGVAFTAIALGGVVGTRTAPFFVARFGAGVTTIAGGFFIASGLVLRAVPTTLAWFAAAQFLGGMADGVHDVAMNVEAVAVDARARRPVVNRLHAVWSIGAVLGGFFGAGLAAADVSVPVHFLAGAAAIAVLNVATGSLAREGTANDDPAPVEEKTRWWHSRALVALATMGIAGSMLEGAPLDWGALYLTDELGTSRATAAATAVTFTIGMVASRLVGDYLIERFGVPAVLRVGAVASGSALFAALAFDHVALVLGAWAVIGAGVAASYPALFVAAGRAPGLPPGAGIGAVSSVARTGFLLGPIAIGAVSERAGLRWALTLPVAAALVIVALANAARRPA